MDGRQGSIVGANIGLLPFSLTAVVLRFLARKRQKSPLSWDDYLVLSAELLTIAGSTLQLYAAINFNFGRHQVNVSPEDLTSFLKSFYAYVILYIITLAIIKSAILCLYRRLFPVRYMKILCTLIQTVVVCWAIAIVLLDIFQCSPITKTFDPAISGHCISEWGFLFGMGLPSVLTDWVILILPIKPVSKLNMPMAKKISVIGLFMLGIFAAVCSIVRLYFVMDDDNNPTVHIKDITYTWARGYYWSSIEIHIALICACLPVFGTYLRSFRLQTGYFRSARSHSGYLRNTANGFPNSMEGSTKAPSEAVGMDSSDLNLTNRSEERQRVGIEEIGLHRIVDVELPLTEIKRIG